MSETTPSTDSTQASSEEKREEANAAASVKKGTGALLLLILISLVWYLSSDRYTPYTSQARIQGFVVGVAPKVAGVVTRVHVKNNQEVSEGQILFEIDRAQYEIVLKRARSDLENVKRQISASSAGVQSSKANLRAAQANKIKAEQDAERQERLYHEDSGTISVRRLEISRASMAQARAGVAVAEAEVQRAIEQKGGDGADNAQLKAALSAVEKAALDLANTKVKASSRGVITDLHADVGQFAGTGSAIMTLIAIHDIWISAEFTENNLGHLRIGTPTEIIVDALPGQVFSGAVHSIGLGVAVGQTQAAGNLPTIDNSRDWLRQSQRFPVMIKFNPDQYELLKDSIRIGGQTEVIAYSDKSGLLKIIGKVYIRMMSWISYAY